MSAPTITSRFHAIVTARPLHGTGPPVIDQNYRTSTYESWGGARFQNAKRKKGPNETGVARKARRTSEDEGTGAREATTLFQSRDELLSALRKRFKQTADVDFHGMYEMLDPNTTHKERIQTVANEIWKTTGYRFTVKDHPQLTNGHKTRFWCSQDDAHRSKSSKAARQAQGNLYKPRMTSAGETMAKARFPCRSRLLISSRDSQVPGTRIITVRMHHHLAHEPYVDQNLPPDMAQTILEGYGWTQPEISSAGDSGMETVPPPAPQEEEDEEDDDNSPPQTYEPVEDDVHDISQQPPPPLSVNDHTHAMAPTHHMDNPDPQPPQLQPQTQQIPQTQPTHPPQPPQPSLPEIYHQRMQTHIRNLRDFCDGLEYNLQFNDYRMLDTLEREGGPFLNLVADCLRKEGRLVNAEDPPVLHVTGQMINGASAPGMDAMSIQRSYEGNPGINPRALGC
ncbi:unnamed protein product [Cyclocybe aegerita]|uniref:Uncharacterized protein n=1 Tax=Cyclocybe aegerita TaxID=1973307 RepID=A0A8S0WF02_CYCAE|nr:unnamed protein product [Cyclocybe aegerita]